MLNKTDYIGSLAKGLRVIEAFGQGASRLSVADAAREADLDRATARRCLLTLHALGYADYDGKFFSLTPRVLRLGMSALVGMPLPQLVQPWIDQLSEQIGQSCSVCILDQADIVYVARAAQRRVMSIGLMPGSRLPAHCSSMGRVLLANLPEADARAIVERSDRSPRTPNMLTDPREIMEKIAEARTLGYALINQEVEIGLRSIAVPLYNVQGQVVAALNSGVAAVHAEPGQLVEAFLPALLKVQERLRQVLAI